MSRARTDQRTLVAISRVKNEADIIEPFVRHHAQHFDRIVILDHNSTDGTPAILAALTAEGLPIEVRSSSKFRSQGDDLTDMMREAFQTGADLVVPLDADEFIETPAGTTLKGLPIADAGKPINIFWRNFMYVPPGEDRASSIERMRWRSAIPADLPKVMIPRSVGADSKVRIYEGNHFLQRGRHFVPGDDSADVVLCHFPIRSLDQYCLKVATGALRYIVNSAPDGEKWGWHYAADYDALLAQRLDILAQRMRSESLCYSCKHRSDEHILQPLQYLGGPLLHTADVSGKDFLRGLLLYADTMARELARAKADAAPRKRFLRWPWPRYGS